MNERIETLAKAAGYDSITKDYMKALGFNLETFAELIVRECARIARATPCPDFDEHVKEQLGHTWDMAASEAGREIVKHFRIEK